MDIINAFFLTNPWAIHIVHLAFAILLFFVMNWIGKHSLTLGYMQLSVVFREDTAPAFNFVFKIIGPVVYLILCAVLFQTIKIDSLIDKCYFIVIYYWAFRLIWNIVYNRLRLTDWIQLIVYWTSSIGLALWIYSNIKEVNKILPDGKGLIDQMWILIIAFLYSLFNNLQIGQYRTIKRKDNYIRSRYMEFKDEYNDIIHPFFGNTFYEALTYSIMIYEDFNRPPVIRALENAFSLITHRQLTLGVMQVKTDRYIDNKESVRLALKKIARDNNTYIREQNDSGNDIYVYDLISSIANKYNGGSHGYSNEIIDIFNYINKAYYNNAQPESFSEIREEFRDH